MHRNKVTLVAALPLLVLFISVVNAGNEDPASADNSTSRRSSEEATSILRKTKSLPPGWFSNGKKAQSIKLSDSKNVKRTAHFDTTEAKGKNPARNAASRLRSAQSSVIYDFKSDGSSTANGAAKRTVSSTAEEKPLGLPTESKTKSAQAIIAEETEPDVFPANRNADRIADLSTNDQIDETSEFALQDLGEELPMEHANITSPSDTIESSETHSEDRIVIDNRAQSVVTRSALRHQINEPSTTSSIQSMQLTPIAESTDAPIRTAQRKQNDIGKVENDQDDVLISDQSPVISVKTRGPRTIVVGKPATYVIEATNISDHDAKDVVVNVNIPTWTEMKSNSPTAGAARLQPDDRGNTVMQWTVGKLAGRGKERLTLKIVPRGSRPFDFGVTWSFNPVRSQTQIEVQEPKLDVAVVGPQDVLYGETKIYTITVSNPGTGDAENVMLQLLPLIPSEKSAGVRQLGTLRAGTRRTVEVELTARQTGRLQVRAEARADGDLNSTGQQDVFVRRAVIDLELESPEMEYAGGKARYTVRVSNTGDAIASDVVAVASLPAGATDVTTKGTGRVHPNHAQVHWELGSLRPGSVRVMEFECVLTAAGENRVDVRSVAAGNISSVTSGITLVESLADLKLVVNDPKGAIATGTDVFYEIRIMNRGTKDAKNIEVVGYFSEGIEPTAISGWAGRVLEGQVELDNISRLGPGQEMVVRVRANASRAGNHVFRAELNCNNPETKLAHEEWTRFYGKKDAVRKMARRRSTDGDIE